MNYQNTIKTILVFCSCNFSNMAFTQSHSVSGKITDESTGEYIAGVNICDIGNRLGAISNTYGYYSLLIGTKQAKIHFSCLGYEDKLVEIETNSDTVIQVALRPGSFQIGEAIVNGQLKRNIQSTDMSMEKLSINEIKSIPALAGETDIIKSLQFLPGVNVGNEGVNSISIRGGSSDQNLILLDDAILYNPNHALSFFSTFNPDAISFVDFYKSAFPAKYGGRLSSVIDVRMKEGNNQNFNVKGGIGILGSRLSFEGPIVKNKSSFIISARYSYAGILANSLYFLSTILPSLNDYRKGNEINFYDLNFKFNYKFNELNHVYLSGYLGHDHFYFKNFSDNYNLDWGNISSTLRWNHTYNSKIFSNTSLVFSNYSYSYILMADVRNFLWQANMQNIQLKSDFEYYLNNQIKLKFGVFSGLLNTLPGKISPQNQESITESFTLDKQKSLELGTFAESEFKLFNFLNIRIGTRYTSFSQLGAATVYKYSVDGTIYDSILYSKNEIVKNYNHFEPRVLFNFILNSNASIKVSYTKTYQDIHLLSNSSIGLPTDIWLPSGFHLLPGASNQVAFGIFHNFNDDKIESSIEVYYKKMSNVIDFKDNADLFLNRHIESQILTGYANAYGGEIFINKKQGIIKWWLSYTLSKTTNHIEGINNNEPYPPVYDKRHNLKFVLSYDMNRKWTLSSSFSFASGGNITVPEGAFQYYGSSFYYYTNRNGYKVPPFHELNLSLTKHSLSEHRLKSEWIFSINNIYNRKNVFSIYVRQNNYDLGQSISYKLYMYGIFPSITYNFSF